jgi:AcrR family transcriptional regulator
MNHFKNTKYQNIYNTGKILFWKYGIKRVSIEEICREAKVSKMTFYKFFPNKIELAKTIIDILFDESLNRFEETVTGEMAFPDKIKALFKIKMDAARYFSMELMDDLYKNPIVELQQLIEEKSKRSLNIFIQFLKNSQAKGLFRKDVKIDFILSYFTFMTQVLENKKLLAQYDHPHDLVIESMNFMFYGLSIQDE